MQKIQFLGAAGGVTGSSYLITADNGEMVLVDLGMFQGTDEEEDANFVPLMFNPIDLQAVFVTHAHLDHCGRLPLLVKQGFKGKIYTTEATKLIIHIALLDAAAIAHENTRGPLLYTKDDVELVYSKIESVSYDNTFSAGGLSVTFRNAGHILGSSSIEISDQIQTLVFSGDLGNTPEDLIQPTEYIAHADVVVMESTYGDSTHPNQDVSAILAQEINQVEKTGGTLLIPAFSIERSQEIIHLLKHLKQNNKINNATPVFLDSPMAIEVVEIFKQFPDLYNSELSRDHDPFNFPNLSLTKTPEESKGIRNIKGAKVIIAGSGMMSGGRIMHHLSNYISVSTTRVLIVGYQAVGTLGRDIQEGVKEITLYDKPLPVRATITSTESLSSHADQPKLLAWLKAISGVKKVFITHGDQQPRIALAEKIKTELGIPDVTLPNKGETFDL